MMFSKIYTPFIDITFADKQTNKALSIYMCILTSFVFLKIYGFITISECVGYIAIAALFYILHLNALNEISHTTIVTYALKESKHIYTAYISKSLCLVVCLVALLTGISIHFQYLIGISAGILLLVGLYVHASYSLIFHDDFIMKMHYFIPKRLYYQSIEFVTCHIENEKPTFYIVTKQHKIILTPDMFWTKEEQVQFLRHLYQKNPMILFDIQCKTLLKA